MMKQNNNRHEIKLFVDDYNCEIKYLNRDKDYLNKTKLLNISLMCKVFLGLNQNIKGYTK